MEILVAASLLAIMGGLMWTSFSSTLDAKERITAATDRMDELRIAMSRMSSDISMAFLSGHFAKEERRTKTIFKEASGGAGDKLVFTAFAHQPMVKDVNESDQIVLSYLVDQDPEDGSVQSLIRRHKRRVDEDPEYGGVDEVLCPNVKDVTFDFWNDPTEEWKESWDTEGLDTPNVLPKRVRITLVANDENGKELKLTTQTSILLWQILNF
jgi:general secretion pathway protein J